MQTFGKGQFEDQPLVLKTPGNPYFIGVCEERHGGSKCRLEILGISPGSGNFFPEFSLADFESLDADFVSLDEGLALRVHHPVNELGHLRLDFVDFSLPPLLAGCDALAARLPELLEYLVGQHEHIVGRAHVLQNGFELPFDLVARHRLAVVGAFLVGAVVIGIVLVAALGRETAAWR
ncbi:hypothetical protein [Novosphingobium sp. CF614]|uniref:hypothetical protein n=1 Tax=Novosphingobium sp. CF614 TaxID=1884364 RepID=UPI000B879346|nr:hypothetical protein [Novosphingobium sp. CF614]